METIHRGNAAEAAVLARLISGGIHVLLPFGNGLAFDLAAAIPPEGRVLRIQVKSGRIRKGCIRFNTYSTDHGNGQQTYDGRADLIAVHVRSIDAVFMVPVTDCPRSEAYLRLVDAKNNQRRRIRLAADYSFEKWISSLPRAYREYSDDADSDHRRHSHAEGQPTPAGGMHREAAAS